MNTTHKLRTLAILLMLAATLAGCADMDGYRRHGGNGYGYRNHGYRPAAQPYYGYGYGYGGGNSRYDRGRDGYRHHHGGDDD